MEAMSATRSTWRNLLSLLKGQLNAQDVLNDWKTAFDLNQPYIVSSTNVNAAAAANTLLWTVPDGKKFLPFMAIVRPVTLSTPGGSPAFAIGTNSTSFNNIMSSTTLVLDAMTKYAPISFFPTTAAVKSYVSANTAIYCKVGTAGTGTYTCAVDLLGRTE
jgi:hypothetical protein